VKKILAADLFCGGVALLKPLASRRRSRLEAIA